MVLKPEQLSEMFGAIARPTAALALEAAIDAHLNILFNHSAAGTHGRALVPDLVEPFICLTLPTDDQIAAKRSELGNFLTIS